MKLARDEKKSKSSSKPSGILKNKLPIDSKAKRETKSNSDSDQDDPENDVQTPHGSSLRFETSISVDSSIKENDHKTRRPTTKFSSVANEDSIAMSGRGSKNPAKESNATQSESDVMKEFEDLLEFEAPPIEVKEKNSDKAAPSNKQLKTKKSKKSVKSRSFEPNEDLLKEVEQVSYEARLAKLILLRKRRKNDESNVEGEGTSNIDFSPGLAFQESLAQDGSQLNSMYSVGSHLNSDKNSGENAESIKMELSTTPSLKDILKQKRAKKKQKVDVIERGAENEFYWG